MSAAGSWSLGVLIGLPIAAVVFVALVVTAFLLLRWYSHNRADFDSGVARVLGWVAVVGAFAVLVVTAVSMYPWRSDYHRWQTKSGTVAQVSSRLLSADKSVEQKFVVQFTDGGEFGCSDTRCSLIKPGDRLSLSCKRTWQFSGRDGWDCNYVDRQGTR